MRFVSLIFILSVFALGTLAYAGDKTTKNAAAGSGAQRAAVIADEDAGIVRVIIAGREVARFDANGLYIRDSIEYGGTLTDTGTASFDGQSKGGADAP